MDFALGFKLSLYNHYGDKKFKICELLPKAQSFLVKKRKIRSQQVARAQKKQRLEKREKNLADLLKQPRGK